MVRCTNNAFRTGELYAGIFHGKTYSELMNVNGLKILYNLLEELERNEWMRGQSLKSLFFQSFDVVQFQFAFNFLITFNKLFPGDYFVAFYWQACDSWRHPVTLSFLFVFYKIIFLISWTGTAWRTAIFVYEINVVYILGFFGDFERAFWIPFQVQKWFIRNSSEFSNNSSALKARSRPLKIGIFPVAHTIGSGLMGVRLKAVRKWNNSWMKSYHLVFWANNRTWW